MIEGSKNDWRTPGRLTEQFASKFNVPNSSAHRSPDGCIWYETAHL